MTTNQLTPAQIESGGFFLDGTGWGYGQEVSVGANGPTGPRVLAAWDTAAYAALG